MIARRDMLAVLGATLLAPLPTFAQPGAGKIPRIGYLGLTENPDFDAAFRGGLKELGYVEGKTIHIEYRYAGGNAERLPGLAAELIAGKPALIVSSSTQATVAAKNATTTVPIVFPVTFDPVASGFVVSLAHPGRNLTGFSPLNVEIMAKRVELLREIAPRMSRVAVLVNPSNAGAVPALEQTRAAVKHFGMSAEIAQVRETAGLDTAFRAAAKARVNGLVVIPDAMFNTIAVQIAALAAKHQLPAIYNHSGYVAAGGLMSYGASIPDLYRRAAEYVDKILKGARPADLPVQQATRFELAINMKAANTLGLKIPNSILVQATKVIE